MKQKDLEAEVGSYFKKNRLAGLNSVFVKFGHGMAVIKAVGELLRRGALVESGEMTYKVYRWRDK